jgi:DNA modification methylase
MMKAKAKPVQQLLAGTEANHLYRGDCLNVLDGIEDESVDLIYIDPPFFSQRYYETFWGEDQERFAFKDRWEGGIQTYISYLTDRCRKLSDKLKPTGSLYVHLDWHICHYMKVELDKIFGYGNFRNEVIWHYKFRMMQSDRIFNRKHDDILFYAKSGETTVNQITEPWTREEIIRVRKQAIYTDKGGEWIWMPGGKGHSKNKKKYLSEIIKEGKAIDDVWDMPIISSSAKERMGYPTQKPLALLQRIVAASSDAGGLVLDAFCGCGTTMEAAQLLGRRWIGIDISQSALRVVENRLRKIGAPPAIMHNMVETEEELHALTWQEFQNWAVDAIQGRHSPRKIADMGIDGFTFMEHHPIQVKQMIGVGRPVIDNFVGVLDRQKDKRGLIIAFDFTKGAIAEVARLQREDKIEIELLTCKQLIEEEIPFRKMV